MRQRRQRGAAAAAVAAAAAADVGHRVQVVAGGDGAGGVTGGKEMMFGPPARL